MQHDARLVGGIYRVGQIISSRAMLTTCTAYDRNTNDVVGLTVIALPPGSHPSSVQPYFHTLQQLRAIQSPHILHVHGWGVEGARMYIVTDPPRGTTLQHVIDNENIDLRRSLNLIRQLAGGLQVLHGQHIGGLDLRPQLITVDEIGVQDRVQIDDIGLRMLLRHLGYSNSQSPDDIGYLDPHYAPPEYISNGQAGPWSDIYQLGLLLFTLVTGRLPFVGQNPAETGVMQNSSPLPDMVQFAYNTPQKLQEVVEMAMAKDTMQRFGNVQAFLKALDSVPLPPVRKTPELPIAHDVHPVSQSVGLTLEMTEVDDVALISTQIEGLTEGQKAQVEEQVALEKGAYAYLRFEKENRLVQRFPIIQKNSIIGRHDPKRGTMPDIDLKELDPKMTVSRLHARIHYEETFFYIEDLKSRNKTRLGELSLTPLKAELLQHGDTIWFGSIRLRFEIAGRPLQKEKEQAE